MLYLRTQPPHDVKRLAIERVETSDVQLAISILNLSEPSPHKAFSDF